LGILDSCSPLLKVTSICYGAGATDVQVWGHATELEATAFMERIWKIGRPQGPVVFLLRYHLEKRGAGIQEWVLGRNVMMIVNKIRP
jgi:hypothetical protein